jgi:hypothetical protein
VRSIEQASGSIDTVVDFGIIHHVVQWHVRGSGTQDLTRRPAA